MMKKASLWLAISLIATQISTHSFANTKISIGETQTVSSSILNENREIQIYLPSSYEKYPSQDYPVIYLLDGENNFHYLTGFVQKLSKAPYPSMPEMIVVGIVNTERSRDLTPTAQRFDSEAKDSKRIEGTTGGNMAFFQFLETEVIPDIEKKYLTNGLNIFVGHSFGGITALNHMLNGTKEMQAYIVHDPSIWWDDEVMLQRFQDAKGKDFQNKKLFITQVGESENTERTSSHYKGIQKLNDYLQTKPFKNLSYQYKQYEGEDHGSVPLKGNLDGLRYIFDNIKINIKDIPNQPNLVQEHYAKLSQNLGFEMQPSEPYLDAVLNYLKRLDDPKIAEQFQEYIISIYPKGNVADVVKK